MDLPALHAQACRDFVATVGAVGEGRWAAPTPCEDWDVGALVNHVVGEDRWTPPLLAGQTLEQVGDRFEGDLLGDHPARAAREAAEAAIGAVASPDALTRTVHLSFGDVPGEEYVWQLFVDHLIHRWDLGVALGREPRLDPELLAVCEDWFRDREELYRRSGAIGPRVDVAADAGQQTRVLAAFGRVSSTVV